MRWVRLVGRWISSGVGWLVLSAIYLFIFTPIGFVNRIIRRDPLRIHGRNRQSYWLPINSPKNRKSLRHSYLLESKASQSGIWTKCFRIVFKIGVIAAILPIADCILGHVLHHLVGGTSIIGLFVEPPPVQSGAPAWQAEFLAESAAAGHMDYRPYTSYRRRDFKGKYVNIQNGIRLTDQAPIQVSHPKKLFMFGGSTMWGVGVRDADTLPSEVARLFEQDNVACQVTNYGEAGWVSWQGVLQLEDLCASGDVPDAVVFYDGVNEVFAKLQSPEERRPLTDMGDLARGFSFVSTSSLGTLPPVLADIYRRNSLVFDILHILAEGPVRAREPLKFSKAEKVPVRHLAAGSVRDYLGTCEVVRALAKQYKFRALFVWQPVLPTKRSPSPAEREILKATRVLDIAFYREVYAAASSLVGQETACINLSNAFDDTDETYYVDWCHLSERGNRLIAARLYKDIKPLLSDSKPAR